MHSGAEEGGGIRIVFTSRSGVQSLNAMIGIVMPGADEGYIKVVSGVAR